MFTIMRAAAGDDELVARAAELFDDPPVPEHTATFLATPGHHLLFAVDGDDPIGFVTGVEMVHPDKGREMCVYELGTREDRRREGVATALLAALRDVATELGCYGLWVATEPDNEPAIATYRSSGYVGPTDVVHLEHSLP